MKTYDFHVYAATPDGDVSADPVQTIQLICFDLASARSAARKMAAKQQGPVDVAVAGHLPWNDRYVGTASPRYPYTASRATDFDRLD